MRPLRVCVDARLRSGLSGGIEQVAIGLAASLSKLDGGDEEYLFLAYEGEDEWLRPYLSGPCRLLHVGRPPTWSRRRYQLRERLSVLPGIQPPPAVLASPDEALIPSSGTIEMAAVDVVHFPSQNAFLTEIPSIFHPHDLQHVHLPELFSKQDYELREHRYRAYCGQAELVVLMTSWGRKDVLSHYALPPKKVSVVTWGSVIDAYPEPTEADLAVVTAKLGLPGEFLLYPAQTWPHKNHEKLLEALAILRYRHGTELPLVCPGRRNDHYPELAAQVERLGLADSVSFPGFVEPLELRCLYALAKGLAFPSKFEGWGMPICEAFHSGVPAACSSATGIPDTARGAALIFDPDQPGEIADAIWRLWSDERLRSDLAEKGRARDAELSVDRAARLFRAHYRRLGGRPLTGEDQQLLAARPLA